MFSICDAMLTKPVSMLINYCFIEDNFRDEVAKKILSDIVDVVYKKKLISYLQIIISHLISRSTSILLLNKKTLFNA